MLGLLIGRLGMSKADALTLTAAQISSVVKHGVEREQEEWKRTRWLATILVNISGKSVKRAVTEKELLRFANETKTNGFSEFQKAAQHGARHTEQGSPRN